MKPVAIFRHTATEGPGYFATFLQAHSIPFKLIAVDRGDAVPVRPDDFSGLCFMGGPMSVNDPLPWIDETCALIRAAVQQGIPVIGHCLGGQLMSKALGGTVSRNPVKELGWGEAAAEVSEATRRWLGDMCRQDPFAVFQWHGETFSLPAGASRLLTNDYCANQAFVLGPHLALQCHVEMTPEMIATWCEDWPSEVANMATLPPPVQTPPQMQTEITARLPAMRALADRLYTVWTAGLAHESA